MNNSLFEFAPKELTGSAFWAWVLNSLAHDKTSERAKLAKRFLTLCNLSGKNISVKREVSCSKKNGGKKGRADIVLYSGHTPVAIIENKLFSTPEPKKILKQLKNYKDSLKEENPDILCIAMTWRYDTEKSWSCKTVPLISLQKQLELLQGINDPIVIEYYHHAKNTLEKRDKDLKAIHAKSLFNEINERNSAHDGELLHSHDTQWELMSDVLPTSDNFSIYNGANRDGTPWTQASFKVEKRSFFYRIDKGKNGYYLRLNYYTKNPKTNEEQDFIEKISQLKQITSPRPWAQNKSLPFEIKNRKGKETTLWHLWMKDMPVSINKFQIWLDSYHKAFKAEIDKLVSLPPS